MDQFDILEQLEKKVAWLDGERRKDKDAIALLQKKFENVEAINASLKKTNSQLEEQIQQINNTLGSVGKYDLKIDRVQSDLAQKIKDSEDKLAREIIEKNKLLKLELDAANRTINDLASVKESLSSTQSDIKSHSTEFPRLTRAIEEIKQKVSEVNRFDEDYKRSLHLMEESHRQDAKRISDVQGEMVAQRKRLEENRSRIDLSSDSYRQIDNRINELQALEKERREAQNAFFDRINLQAIERDKVFKDWAGRFTQIEAIDEDLDAQLTFMKDANKNSGKAIATMEEITQRMERRINEISEINRLNDERFRQEWTAFKTDDQKRWTNYILGQEEQHREMNRQLENIQPQLVELDNSLKNTLDLIDQVTQDSVNTSQIILKAYQESILTQNELRKQRK